MAPDLNLDSLKTFVDKSADADRIILKDNKPVEGKIWKGQIVRFFRGAERSDREIWSNLKNALSEGYGKDIADILLAGDDTGKPLTGRRAKQILQVAGDALVLKRVFEEGLGDESTRRLISDYVKESGSPDQMAMADFRRIVKPYEKGVDLEFAKNEARRDLYSVEGKLANPENRTEREILHLKCKRDLFKIMLGKGDKDTLLMEAVTNATKLFREFEKKVSDMARQSNTKAISEISESYEKDFKDISKAFNYASQSTVFKNTSQKKSFWAFGQRFTRFELKAKECAARSKKLLTSPSDENKKKFAGSMKEMDSMNRGINFTHKKTYSELATEKINSLLKNKSMPQDIKTELRQIRNRIYKNQFEEARKDLSSLINKREREPANRGYIKELENSLVHITNLATLKKSDPTIFKRNPHLMSGDDLVKGFSNREPHDDVRIGGKVVRRMSTAYKETRAQLDAYRNASQQLFIKWPILPLKGRMAGVKNLEGILEKVEAGAGAYIKTHEGHSNKTKEVKVMRELLEDIESEKKELGSDPTYRRTGKNVTINGKEYRTEEKLGTGKSGTSVYLGSGVHDKTGKIAFKMGGPIAWKGQTGKPGLSGEKDVYEKLGKHDHIVGYKGFAAGGQGGEDYAIFMEYVPGKDLYEFKEVINSHKNKEESLLMKKYLANQCLSALKHIHSKDLSMTDFGDYNCLVGTDGVLKVFDFDMATKLDKTKGPVLDIARLAGMLKQKEFFGSDDEIAKILEQAKKAESFAAFEEQCHGFLSISDDEKIKAQGLVRNLFKK